MLTMLFTLDMPSLWDLSRASGDTVAPYVFVPPCFYPPHLRKHHHMSSVRSVKLFRNRWPASAPWSCAHTACADFLNGLADLFYQ